MEAILLMPSPEKGRDFVLPLSLGGVRVRMVVQSGSQLLAELSREPVEAILLPEALPDGPAEQFLAKVAALPSQRPLAVVLIYGVESSEAVRERVRGVYGPAADVVAAGARSIPDTASEAASLLDRLERTIHDQDQSARQRLNQPTDPTPVPQPVKRSGAIACVGASGGVGLSTLVVNLGAFAAMNGQRVLLVDANFSQAGALSHYLAVQADETSKGMHHLRWAHASAQGEVKESLADEVLGHTEPVELRRTKHADLRLMGAPAIFETLTSLPVEQLTWAIQVLQRRFDLVLIDCGAGLTDPRTQQLMGVTDRIFVVAGGWGASVHALSRTLTAMEGRPEVERLFLLLREAGEGAYGARTVCSATNLPVYGRIPEDPQVRRADLQLGARVPLVLDEPKSPYAQAVSQIAYGLGLVEQATGTVAKKRSWFRFGRAGA